MESSKLEFKSKIVKFSLGGKATQQEEEHITPTDIKLPDDSPARTKILRSEGKKWYLTVVYHEKTEQPFALFCRTNNREKTVQTSDAVDRLLQLARDKGILEEHVATTEEKSKHDPNVDKLTRVISLLLRHGVLVKNIVAELNKMEDVFVGSFLFQIRKFLSQYIKDGESVDGEACVECGGKLIYTEGCMRCLDCGASKCG